MSDPNAGPGPFITPVTISFAVATVIFFGVAVLLGLFALPLWTPLGILLSLVPGVGNILLIWFLVGWFRKANISRILLWFCVGVLSVLVIFIVELIVVIAVAVFMMVLTDIFGVQEGFLYFLGAADQEGQPLQPPNASFLPFHILFSVLMAANAAVVEELAKWGMVKLILQFNVNPKRTPNVSAVSVVIYAVAAVAGFASTENIEYDLNQPLLVTVLTPLFRSLMPLHYFTVIIMSTKMAANEFELDSYSNFFFVMWLPILLHFTYDFVLFAVMGVASVKGVPSWLDYTAIVGACVVVAGVLLTGLFCSIFGVLKLWRQSNAGAESAGHIGVGADPAPFSDDDSSLLAHTDDEHGSL